MSGSKRAPVRAAHATITWRWLRLAVFQGNPGFSPRIRPCLRSPGNPGRLTGDFRVFREKSIPPTMAVTMMPPAATVMVVVVVVVVVVVMVIVGAIIVVIIVVTIIVVC